jgi:hypothetical protein
VDGKGWTFVKDLKPGDLLVQSDRNTLKIDSIEPEYKHATVCIMTVDDFHTYFVSDLGIWVNNTSCGLKGMGKTAEWSSEKGIYEVGFETRLEKGVDYPNVSDARHFQTANKQLYEAFQADSEFAQEMERIYLGIIDGVQPGAR